MKIRKKISYIAEINLDSKSAYKHQVLKMCDAFSQQDFEVTLYVINSNNVSFKKLKKKHLLKTNFKIKNIYKSVYKLNFLFRIIFAIRIFLILKNKKEIFYSRSVLTSIILSLFGLKNVLEIHQPNSGFTNLFFNILKKKIVEKKIKFVFIHKNLNKYFLFKKKLFIVADDGVDLKDFKIKKNIKYNNTCVYTGSLFPGKGIEIILKIAEKMNHFNFYVYGDLNTSSNKTISECNRLKNIKLLGHIDYYKIPRVLKCHKIIIMPYSKIIYGNHKSMNIANYISPLKLFDYLAAGRIIIASKNKNYSHILKDKKNSFLCDPNNIKHWEEKIKLVTSKKFKYKKMRYNSLKTAKSFSWNLRVKKITKFIEKNNI